MTNMTLALTPRKVLSGLITNARRHKLMATTTLLTLGAVVSLFFIYDMKQQERLDKFVARLPTELDRSRPTPTIHISSNHSQPRPKVLASSKHCPGLSVTLPVAKEKFFQVVDGTNIFVYSAYANGDEVRIIAVMNQLERNQNLMCYLWYDVTGGVDSLSVMVAVVEPIPEDHQMPKTAAFIRCQIPAYRSGQSPDAVSVIKSQADCKMATRNILPVQKLGQIIRTFTLCVSPFHRNYSDVHQLVEMIEFNRILGAEMIAFYDYSSSPAVHKVLENYKGQGLVEVHPWNLPATDIHYHGQLAALNDCLYQYRNTSRYLVNQDLDEFIIPQGKLTTWTQLLDHRKKSRPEAGIFVVRNVFFRTEGPGTWANFTLNVKAQKYRSVVLQHTVREKKVFPYNDRSKYIVDPWNADCLGIHFVWKEAGQRDSVPPESALLYHYRSWESPKVRDDVARAQDVSVVQRFGEKLVNALDKAWTSLNQSNSFNPKIIKGSRS